MSITVAIAVIYIPQGILYIYVQSLLIHYFIPHVECQLADYS